MPALAGWCRVAVARAGAKNSPPPPPFPQSGTDVATQIAPGDLFDFDTEVAPILEVLVGRTLEQAVAEVAMERELAAIRAKREEFEAVRAAELHEILRLEGEVKRRAAEKARRRAQEEARLAAQVAVREKVAAAAFARSYLSAMRRNVFGALHEAGHFYDPLKRELAAWLVPVYADVAARTSGEAGGARGVAEGLLAGLIKRALELGAEKAAQEAAEKAAREAQRLLDEAAERARRAAAKVVEAAPEEEAAEEDKGSDHEE